MRLRTLRLASGLTILELLVTLAALTILAGLLIPAVTQARAAARRNACQSNLRQWVFAARIYADAHHGRLPYRGQGVQPTTRLDAMNDWFNAIPQFMEVPPYIELIRADKRPKAGDGSVWVCPDADLIAYPTQPTFFAYAMNMALSTPFNGRPDNIEKIGLKQTMVFMADSLGPFCSTLPSDQAFTPIDRHLGNTVNVVFLDGRVETYAGDYIGCHVGDPKHEHIRWHPPNSKWPGPPNK